MIRTTQHLIGGLFLFAMGLSSAQASIIGETIRIDWLFPNSTTVFLSSGNVVVSDPGVEWTPGEGVGGIDVGDGTITIQNFANGWAAATFNGFRFTDISGFDDFTSFSLVSVTGNVPPIGPQLSFTGNELLVNFNSTGENNIGTGSGGQVYTFSFTTAAVPEPATLALMGLGFAGLALSRRRKQA